MFTEATDNVVKLCLDGEELNLIFIPVNSVPGKVSLADNNFDCGGIANIKEKIAYRHGNEEFQFIAFFNAPGIAYRRIIKAENSSLKIDSIVEKITFGPASELYPDKASFCFHAENTRLYELFTIASLSDRSGHYSKSFEPHEPISGTLWAGKGNLRREIGRSPFQPFPVMIWGTEKSDRILLDGTLSQKRLYRYYKVENGEYICFQAPKAIDRLIIAQGDTLEQEWNYLEIGRSKDLNHPYSGFLAALHNFKTEYRGNFPGNHNDVIWGSWNHGIFRDIDQQRILDNADFIKQHFPTVKWIQIDDGYDQWDYSENNKRIGIGVAYPGEGFSRDKFPDGPKVFTEAVKKRGLRPALWVGLAVSSSREPFKSHPEWFVDYCQSKEFRFLDISREDVRLFIREAFRMFFQDWGFEGIKLDFWSYFFEDEQIALSQGTVTGGEYRQWFLETCREFMPKDGYLQTGCDIAMGNIHLAEYVDNYRYGIDIGHGAWNNVLTNAKWAAFCLNTHTGKDFVPNSDSIGYFPGLSRTESETAINFCLITRTLVEISGWLYQQPDHSLLPFLIKACACPDNGEDIYFGNFNFRSLDAPPSVWFFKTPHFSRDRNNPYLPIMTVCVFNWTDQVMDFEFEPQHCGLDCRQNYLLKDFWSDELFELRADKKLHLKIAPHHSRLFSVTANNPAGSLLDADVQVNNVEICDNILSAQLPFAGETELSLSFQPAKIMINGKEVEFEILKSGNLFKAYFSNALNG